LLALLLTLMLMTTTVTSGGNVIKLFFHFVTDIGAE
jgi:hypothetical protein